MKNQDKKIIYNEQSYIQKINRSDLENIYLELKSKTYDCLSETETGATEGYISWGINHGKQFANIALQKRKNRIEILTRTPINKYNIGEKVSDKHQWILNYRSFIYSSEDIKEVKPIIEESYHQVMLKRSFK